MSLQRLWRVSGHEVQEINDNLSVAVEDESGEGELERVGGKRRPRPPRLRRRTPAHPPLATARAEGEPGPAGAPHLRRARGRAPDRTFCHTPRLTPTRSPRTTNTQPLLFPAPQPTRPPAQSGKIIQFRQKRCKTSSRRVFSECKLTAPPLTAPSAPISYINPLFKPREGPSLAERPPAPVSGTGAPLSLPAYPREFATPERASLRRSRRGDFCFPAKEINSRYAGQQLGNRAQRHRRQQAEKHQGHDRFPLLPSKRNQLLLCWTTTRQPRTTPLTTASRKTPGP